MAKAYMRKGLEQPLAMSTIMVDTATTAPVISQMLMKEDGRGYSSGEVVVSPPYVFLPLVKSELRPEIQVPSQNCWVKKGGAYTGEVS
ncbi:hypothetical protein QQ045_022525 [Rhodiola kirilowii]